MSEHDDWEPPPRNSAEIDRLQARTRELRGRDSRPAAIHLQVVMEVQPSKQAPNRNAASTLTPTAGTATWMLSAWTTQPESRSIATSTARSVRASSQSISNSAEARAFPQVKRYVVRCATVPDP